MNKLRQVEKEERYQKTELKECGRHAQEKQPLYIRFGEAGKEGILIAIGGLMLRNFALAIGEIWRWRSERRKEGRRK